MHTHTTPHHHTPTFPTFPLPPPSFLPLLPLHVVCAVWWFVGGWSLVCIPTAWLVGSSHHPPRFPLLRALPRTMYVFLFIYIFIFCVVRLVGSLCYLRQFRSYDSRTTILHSSSDQYDYLLCLVGGRAGFSTRALRTMRCAALAPAHLPPTYHLR